MTLSTFLLENINPIENIDKAEKLQEFYISEKDKAEYGIIYTPFSLIKKMFNLIPPIEFTKLNNKWLDIGAGTGYFSIYLYHTLYKTLKKQIPDNTDRKNHIIKNMIYMAEIKKNHILILKNLFGPQANIISNDFLSINIPQKFDIIIGNPPYNSNGQIKTPTNTKIEKIKDGKTVWIDFIKKSINLLNKKGYLLPIIPAIWLKPDKAMMYKFLTQYKIITLHTLTNAETNKIFNYQAQTPTCYFLLENTLVSQSQSYTHQIINIFDKYLQKYIEYSFFLERNKPIPLSSISIIKKLSNALNTVNHLPVLKTNMPPQKSKFSLYPTEEYKYKCIKTCIFGWKISSNTIPPPEIIYEYSNIPQSYYNEKNEPKLILAHKMYGFPFIDEIGNIGISNRDNYVIINKSLQELKIIKKFLESKLVLSIYDSTRYRMRYLEKYAFEFIPDITKLLDFPEEKHINDETIANYFNFSEEEREIIEKNPKYIYFN